MAQFKTYKMWIRLKIIVTNVDAAENIKQTNGSLLYRNAENIKKTEENLKKGQFSMQDYLTQLRQMKKMGGIEGIMSFMPGVSKIKSQMDTAGVDEKIIIHGIWITQVGPSKKSWVRRKLSLLQGSSSGPPGPPPNKNHTS